MFGVNCKQDGWPDRPQSEHDTKSSGTFVLRFSRESPKQKSQYGDGGALPLSFGLRIMRKRSSSSSGPPTFGCTSSVGAALMGLPIGGAITFGSIGGCCCCCSGGSRGGSSNGAVWLSSFVFNGELLDDGNGDAFRPP